MSWKASSVNSFSLEVSVLALLSLPLAAELDAEDEEELVELDEASLDSDDEEDGDAQCYILKDTSAAEDEEAVYEFVEDDTEFDAISRIFAELMDDGVELA